MTPRPAHRLPALAGAALLALSGCSSAGEQDSLLTEHGLEGKSTVEIVEALDSTNDDRESGLMASIDHDTLTLADGSSELELAVPDDQFYLAVAPYVASTHDCYHHNLVTCQGELAGQQVEVTVTDADGRTLVDETVTAYDNGFVGLWLPRDIEGTLELGYDGLTATAPFGTGEGDPTCVTTMQLG